MRHISNKTGFIMLILFLSVLTIGFKTDNQDEGMYPLAQLGSLDLAKAGLQIPQGDIYTPGQVGLTNALVQLGGCTGSFISDKGLIITNHHCVFSAVAAASTEKDNYLENGFYAATDEQEIKTSLPCRITVSFEDVSEAVLEGVDSKNAPENQQNTIRNNIKNLTKAEQEKYPDLEIQISEMFVGKYYTLFRYKTLDDVRLVYVPPKAIGKFGGESDNWMWPRHNADFGIVRAYENGKPFNPDKYLKIDSDGTKEGDFIFILGYPGRTYRHAPAQFLTYQNEHILPLISSLFDEYIYAYEEDAGNDETKKLAIAGRVASLSNTTKNFKGKMQGFRRTNIIEERYAEQDQMVSLATQNKNQNEVNILKQIDAAFQVKNKLADDYILLNQLFTSRIFNSAFTTNKMKAYSISENDKAIKQENLTKMASEITLTNNPTLDNKLFVAVLYRLYKNNNPAAIDLVNYLKLKNPSKQLLEKTLAPIWNKSIFTKTEKMKATMESSPEKLASLKDVTQTIAAFFDKNIAETSEQWQHNEATINALLPQLADMRQKYQGGNFVPDANSTLRLTYGYIKGYQPNDAVYNEPFTTIKGIIEKANPNNPNDDYYMPGEFLETFKTVQAADNLVNKKNNQVVVGLLYNLDTTGGNSGSPILNAKGELVGVNFDRAYSATINDFEWNESYSRSIGVDIRYVLYVMKYINNADRVLDELGIEL
ncbi:MAG: S46 family peptidase [Bacteroidia bacterium]